MRFINNSILHNTNGLITECILNSNSTFILNKHRGKDSRHHNFHIIPCDALRLHPNITTGRMCHIVHHFITNSLNGTIITSSPII